jgi:6,7-dimethyl-8-ribityllumazine synthase
MEYKGKIKGKGLKIAIIVSRFNSRVTEKLKDGAIDCLERHEVNEKDVDLYWTPGSFELPMLTNRVINRGGYDGYIVLGALIRGDTPHFEYLASEVTKGIAKIGIKSDKPVAFGIITSDTEEQALSRAGMKVGNKGWDAALSILEMIDLYKTLK